MNKNIINLVSKMDLNKSADEKEMLKVINGHESIHHNYELVKSVDGVGLITAVELLVKTENFTKITHTRSGGKKLLTEKNFQTIRSVP